MNNRIRERLVGSEILRMKEVQQYNIVRALTRRFDWAPEMTAIIGYEVKGNRRHPRRIAPWRRAASDTIPHRRQGVEDTRPDGRRVGHEPPGYGAAGWRYSVSMVSGTGAQAFLQDVT
ncbi:hypothetical protein PG984_005650 [Apiospora sp. TS-2023a]